MTQHPLADPYAHVHPFFWPVLWLSLRAFVRWTGRMIEAGHGFAGLRVELTWYGVIRVRTLDLSQERAAFHRHMMGAPREDGWGALADAAGRVEALLAEGDRPLSANRRDGSLVTLNPQNAFPSPDRGRGVRGEGRDLSSERRLPNPRPPPSARAVLKSLTAISGRLHPSPANREREAHQASASLR